MKTEILTACDQLVSAAINGVYQGIVIAVLVALSLRLLGRTNAATRHAVWFCTLLLLVSLIVAHCLVDSVPFTPRPAKTSDIATVPNANVDLPPVVAVAGSAAVVEAEIDSPAAAAFHGYLTSGLVEELEKLNATPSPSIEAAASESQSNPIANTFPLHANPVGNELGTVAGIGGQLVGSNVSSETKNLPWFVERLINPVPLNLALGSRFTRIASLTLLALWLTIASVRVTVLLLQLYRIRELKSRSSSPTTELNAICQMLASRLAVNRKVELKVSPAHRSSFLLGFLHPVILLPAEERMEPGEAEHILRHELAHVQRRDDWANLVQHAILAVFFFHPAVWWISKQLSLEREIACDDHVLQESGQPQTYALLLANLAARMQRCPPLLAPGASNHKTQLKQRIDMILNTHRNTSPRLAKTWLAFITSAAALLAVAIIYAAPRIVLAQNETPPAAADAPSADATVTAPASGVVAIAIASDELESDSADADPQPTPAPAAVGRGPKFKHGSADVVNVRPTVIVAPAAPAVPVAVPVAVVPPVPPTPFLATVQPVPEPRAPRTPRPPRRTADSSLEERLERLEQMVESLMRQNLKPGHSDFHLKGPSEKDVMIDRKEMAKIEALAKQHAELAREHVLNSQEIEQIKEHAEREGRRAADQVKRATADVEKALKADQKRLTAKKFKEGSQKQLEALRKQIEILERQRNELDRKIEQLEQDEEQFDYQDEDQTSDDTQAEEPKAECEVTQPAPR